MATLYYVIYPATFGPEPTAAQVKAGQNPSGAAATASGSETALTADGTQTWATLASGLTAGTDYKIAFVWTDTGVDSSVVVGTFSSAAPVTSFPQSAAVATGRTTGDATSHPITMPSGIAVGDLIVAVVGIDSIPTITIDGASSTGWRMSTHPATGDSCSGAVVWMVAESTTPALTLTTSTSQESSHVVHRITGGGAVEVAVNSGSTVATNPPSLTASYGTSDTLWLATQIRDGIYNKPTAPSGYTDGGHLAANTSGGVSTTTTYKEARAATEDPAAFSTQTSSGMVSFTIAVRPTAFPWVRASETSGSSSTASLSVTLPRHLAGDSLLVFVSANNAPSINTGSSSAGWQVLASTSNTVHSYVLFHPSAPSGSSTLTLSLSSGRISALAYSLGSAGAAAAQSATGTSAAPDAPSITQPSPPEVLYFSAASAIRVSGGSVSVSSGATGYSTVEGASHGSTGYVTVGASYLASDASQDPSAMTLSSSQPWVAWGVSVSRVVVRSAAAAQTVPAPTQTATAAALAGVAASQTVPAPAQTATGSLVAGAVASQTVSAPTQGAAGVTLSGGAAGQTVPAPAQSAAGAARVAAAGSQTAPSPTQSATGSAIAGAGGAQSVPAPGQTSAGVALVFAAANQSVPAPAQTATADTIEAGVVAGSANQSVPAPGQSAAGSVLSGASGGHAVPAPTQDATGAVRAAAESSQSVPAPTQSAAGVVVEIGVATASAGQAVPAPAQAAAGAVRVEASASQTVPPPAQDATGTAFAADVSQASASQAVLAPAQLAQAQAVIGAVAAQAVQVATTIAELMVRVAGSAAQEVPALAQQATGDGGVAAAPTFFEYSVPADGVTLVVAADGLGWRVQAEATDLEVSS